MYPECVKSIRLKMDVSGLLLYLLVAIFLFTCFLKLLATRNNAVVYIVSIHSTVNRFVTSSNVPM